MLGAALRSVVLAALVWLILKAPRLRNPHIQLTAWTVVLVASLLTPATTRLAAFVVPPARATANGPDICANHDAGDCDPSGQKGFYICPAFDREYAGIQPVGRR